MKPQRLPSRLSSLDQLLLEAKTLALRPHSAAVRECVAREAQCIAIVSIEHHGLGKHHAAQAVRQLMRAAEKFGDRFAREKLCEGLGLIVDAMRLERSRPAFAPEIIPYWMKDNAG